MNEALAQLRDILKEKGQSLTTARKAVFLSLLDQPPQTITQLVARARETADRASIYRTVQLFEDLGIIQRLQIGWKYKLELSDVFSGHHHHMTCLRCHIVIEVEEDPSVELLLQDMAIKKGFSMTAHQLELRGYCTNCKDL